MKRILITGANSYLGKSLTEYLKQWPDEFQVEATSVRDDTWKETDFHFFDAIYHTAALVHMEQNKQDPAQAEFYDRVNARLPISIAKKAKAEGVRQFVFLSTAAIYGCTAPYGKTITITADTPAHPVDNYGTSKWNAEQGLRALEDDNFHVTVLRPPLIYGKGCKGNYRTLEAMAKKLPFFPAVSNQRSMLYIGNLNELVRLLLQSGEGGTFCPQNREYANTSHLVRQIAQAHGKRLVLVPGFGWALSLLRHITPAVDKAFGSLCYDPALSQYSKDYCLWDFPASVWESEC